MIEILILTVGFCVVMVLCLCKSASNADEKLDEYYSRKDYYYSEPITYKSETITYKPKRSKFVRKYIPRYLKKKVD